MGGAAVARTCSTVKPGAEPLPVPDAITERLAGWVAEVARRNAAEASEVELASELLCRVALHPAELPVDRGLLAAAARVKARLAARTRPRDLSASLFYAAAVWRLCALPSGIEAADRREWLAVLDAPAEVPAEVPPDVPLLGADSRAESRDWLSLRGTAAASAVAAWLATYRASSCRI